MMHINGILGNSKTKTGTTNLSGVGLVYTIESLKNKV